MGSWPGHRGIVDWGWAVEFPPGGVAGGVFVGSPSRAPTSVTFASPTPCLPAPGQPPLPHLSGCYFQDWPSSGLSAPHILPRSLRIYVYIWFLNQGYPVKFLSLICYKTELEVFQVIFVVKETLDPCEVSLFAPTWYFIYYKLSIVGEKGVRLFLKSQVSVLPSSSAASAPHTGPTRIHCLLKESLYHWVTGPDCTCHLRPDS